MPTYTGWCQALGQANQKLAPRHDGRSWRAHVVIERLGSLGTYRRSRQTGR